MSIYLFLEHIFEGRKRKTGETYTSHPYAVKKILEEEGVTEEIILNAALLHDVLEDTDIKKDYLELRFGEKVAKIVHILSKKSVWVTSYCKMKSNLDQMEGLWVDYPETVIIKMADRLHNLQTIHGFTHEKQKNYINETKKLLIPLFRKIIKRNKLGYLKQYTEKLFLKLEKETASIEHRLFLTNHKYVY